MKEVEKRDRTEMEVLLSKEVSLGLTRALWLASMLPLSPSLEESCLLLHLAAACRVFACSAGSCRCLFEL